MKVRVFEVGVRDGLQNEPGTVSLATKAELARRLIRAGVRDLELGAFVRLDRVPQMADTDAMYKQVRAGKIDLGRTRGWALVPNRRGLERAVAAGVRHIAVFTAATESFALNNIGMSVGESLTEFAEVVRQAHANGIAVRGYVSTVFGCPFEGAVKPARALRVIERLLKLGVDEISIGDTIGVATPDQVAPIFKPLLRMADKLKVAAHFHDTRGTALANALEALRLGVRTFDSSAGGLGGCPFAPGAAGNLATEDLLYMLHGMGITTGIDLAQLADTSLWLARRMRRPLSSRYLNAFSASGGQRATGER